MSVDVVDVFPSEGMDSFLEAEKKRMYKCTEKQGDFVVHW